MHYVDEGQGDAILLVHGTPTWSFEFRHLIAALSARHRCVAPDHFGFGLQPYQLARWQALLPHAETVALEHAGHRLHEEEPARVIAAIEQFLQNA